jgi:hypothetical protein
VRLMSTVGVVGTPLRQSTPNADHTKSYYIMVDNPSDVSCTRIYWTSADKRLPRPSSMPIISGYRHLSAEHLPAEVRYQTKEIIAELQLARTPTIYALAGAVFLLAFVCGYFYRNPIYEPRNYLPEAGIRQVAAAVGALLVAAPGALVAYLTTSLSDLGGYLTRGIRSMCAIGAASAVWGGFCIAVLMPQDHGLYAASLLFASAVNFVAGITALAALLGPRSRDDGALTSRRIRRSRRRAAAAGAIHSDGIPKPLRKSGVAADTRYRQRRTAFLGAIGCAFLTDVWIALLRVPSGFRDPGHKGWWEPLRKLWEYTGTHWTIYRLGQRLLLLNPSHHGGAARLLIALGCAALFLATVLVSISKVGAAWRDRLAHEGQVSG